MEVPHVTNCCELLLAKEHVITANQKKCVRMANPVEVNVITGEVGKGKQPDIGNETQTTWNYLPYTCVSNFDRKGWEAIYAIREPRKNSKLTFKGKIYNFLDRPKGWKAFLYHASVFFLVLASYIFGVMSSAPEYAGMANDVLYYMERALIVIFSCEYILRFWSAGCRGKFSGIKGRIRYFFQPLCIVDLLIVVSSVVFFTIEWNGQIAATSAVRGFRFLQIVRMLRIDRQGGTWQLLKSVVVSHRQELLTTAYVGMLGVLSAAYFLYWVERDHSSGHFSTYGEALWWGLITMTTIGYGDRVPHTTAGKMLAALFALFTVSFFALPAGILGTGFALKVQQQQKRKKFNRQVPAAAILIQSAWRYYASGKHFSSVAAWKLPLAPTNSNVPVQKSKKTTSDLFRKLKPRQITLSDNAYGDTFPRLNESNGNVENNKCLTLEGNGFQSWLEHRPLSQGRIPYMYSAPDLRAGNTNNSDDLQTDSIDYEYSITSNQQTCGTESGYDSLKEWIRTQKILTEAHKNAIRCIRKMKYLVGLRKFQEARRPFEVSDVIEQYTEGQLNMMTRIKELQRRLDSTLGKPGSHLAGNRRRALTIGMQLEEQSEQIVNMKKKIDSMEKKLDEMCCLLKELKDQHPGLPKTQQQQKFTVTESSSNNQI